MANIIRAVTRFDGNKIIKEKVVADDAPAVTDDVTKGYEKGSFWQDDTLTNLWVCMDNAAGAASWELVTSTASGE